MNHATVPVGGGAFTLASAGSTKALTVGIDLSAVGTRSGSVTVTTSGGSPTDLVDTINVSATVLDHANASFGVTDTNSLTINFGTLVQGFGGGSTSLGFNIYNLVTTPSFTATLDLDSVSGTGDTGVLTTNLAPFSGLAAGASPNPFLAFINTSTVGIYSATYTLFLSDQDLTGATSQSLTLNLQGSIEAASAPVPEPSSLALAALAACGFVGVRRRFARAQR